MIAVIFLIVVVGFFGTIMVSLSATQQITSLNEIQSTQALYVAEGGLDRAVSYFLSPTLAGRVTCAGLPGAATPLNPGLFRLNIEAGSPFYSSAATTIAAGGVAAGATVIPVASTANYAPFGRIMIDRELIDYTGTTPAPAASFTGALRGRDGTVPAPHAGGTPVGQDQCTVTSTGGVIDLTPAARGQRVVRAGIQLQEGWLVGNAAGGTEVIGRWNGVTWTQAGPYAAVPNQTFNQVSMLSYADGWAVGDTSGGELIARWDGTTWTRVGPSPVIPNQDLNSVYCVSATDCWAVGAPGGVAAQRPLILQCQGGPPCGWGVVDTSAIDIDRALNAVHCPSAVDCWAVGDPEGVGQRPLILQCQGGPPCAWGVVDTSAININRSLNAVHCPSVTDCWAVGDPGGGGQRPLILQCQGAPCAWSLYNTAAININQALNAVYCNSTTDCWAVGNPGGGGQRPLILRCQGGPPCVWAALNTAAINVNQPLNAIHCTSPNDCWAVGNVAGGGDFLVHWDGAAWARVGPYAGIPNVTIRGLYLIGPNRRPHAVWREVVS